MAKSRRWVGLWTVISLTLLVVVAIVEPPTISGQPDDSKKFDDQFRPLLARHCVECHRGEKPKGNLRLDNLTTDFEEAVTREHWAAVIKRLKAGEMPPKDQPRPPEKDLKALTDWLEARVTAADALRGRLRDARCFAD